jgi:ribosomal-protein-alanine N-acetyltransferase
MEGAMSDLSGYDLRAMEDGDLPEVMALEAGSFTKPWKEDSFLHELHNNPFARNYVARAADGSLAGYASIWLLEGELYINNLNVAPEHRHRRLGHRILHYLLDSGRHGGCSSAVLEVRPSNTAALRLYRAHEFRAVGRRPGYYSDGEDALVLGRKL